MKITEAELLNPRKSPVQARSGATVRAIFEATIQVLLAEGAARLTTTRVARRAGVSVGTMYQYFPHKQALLYAVLRRHLDMVAEAVESACAAHHGEPAAAMADALVTAYLDAKTERIEISRALYMLAAQLDTTVLLAGLTKRLHEAAGAMLASARDVTFADNVSVTFTLLAAINGTTRSVLERGAAPDMLRTLRSQLALMCRTYLAAAGQEIEPAPATRLQIARTPFAHPDGADAAPRPGSANR